MIERCASKVIMENVGHRLFVVCAKDGPITHKRKVYKNYQAALNHANMLMHYYQVMELTEINR